MSPHPLTFGTINMPIYQGDAKTGMHILAISFTVAGSLADGRTFRVTIARGFAFDGCSIPRLLWRLCGHPMEIPRVAAALAHDSHSGLYAPDGYTWVSSPKIAIAGGLAYSRTVTAEGAVWVLEANGMVAETGGLTNGFFRVSDDEGNALFEIVKGDKRTVGASADSVQIVGAFVPTKLQVGYAIQADAHPLLQISTSLTDPDWIAETESSCPATVSWSGVSGAYVATVQAKSTSATQLFVKAEYQVGGETYIKNTAPISAGGGILCTDGVHKVCPVYNNGSITWEVVQ